MSFGGGGGRGGLTVSWRDLGVSFFFHKFHLGKIY